MLSPRQISSTHEDLFVERYDWLLSSALHLTNNDRALAEDLVHDAFIHFTFTHTDPQNIQNLDGYLYIMLRNLYLSHERRTTRSRLQQLSILDYDSVELGLQVVAAQDQIQVQDELRQVCHYACVRKESAGAASVLILRFFHGYYPSEIAQILRTTRRAVDERLRLARNEAKLSLAAPQALGFLRETQIPKIIPAGFARSTNDFVGELRARIFQARRGDCLSSAQLKKLLVAAGAASMDIPILAHIVSCADCIDEVNTILRLPLLADRYPTDTMGKDTRPKGGSGGGSSGGGTVRDAVRRYRRRTRDIFEHRPKELHFLVNGFVLGSQSVNAELSEQTLDINLTEKIGFVEVLSEQEVRLLFFNVEPPPDGPVKQPARVEFSDGRSLDLDVSFNSTWPTLHAVYNDPLLKTQPAANDETESDAAGQANRLERDPGYIFSSRFPTFSRLWILRWLPVKELWLRPSAVTAIVAVIVMGAFLFLRTRGPVAPLSASDLLHRSAVTEEEVAARTDQVLHRTINFEERATDSSSQLIARRKIEVWQSAERGIVARRLYDEHNNLIAGDWRRSDGVRTVYHHGIKPQLQLSPEKRVGPSVSFDSAWQLDLSAKDFISIIGKAENARVEESANTYVLSVESPKSADAPKIGATLVKATLILSKPDLHATQLTIKLQQGNELREYRMLEASFERRTPSTVAPAVFEPEPELLGETIRGRGDSENLSASARLPATSSVPVVATNELEVEVLQALNQAGADLGEQVSVKRTPEGRLQVEGIVDNDRRKSEILRALDTVKRNPAVHIEVLTAAESLERQERSRSRSAIVEQFEPAQTGLPVEADLRRYFSKGTSDAQADQEVFRFADRMLARSRSAYQHAWAIKRLAERFSPDDLRVLDDSARAKWLSMIREHARAFQRETASLRQELQPVFFPRGDFGAIPDEVAIASDSDLQRVSKRLYEMALANNEVIRSAFSVSSETGTAANMRAPQFWRALKSSEKLAVEITAMPSK